MTGASIASAVIAKMAAGRHALSSIPATISSIHASSMQWQRQQRPNRAIHVLKLWQQPRRTLVDAHPPQPEAFQHTQETLHAVATAAAATATAAFNSLRLRSTASARSSSSANTTSIGTDSTIAAPAAAVSAYIVGGGGSSRHRRCPQNDVWCRDVQKSLKVRRKRVWKKIKSICGVVAYRSLSTK